MTHNIPASLSLCLVTLNGLLYYHVAFQSHSDCQRVGTSRALWSILDVRNQWRPPAIGKPGCSPGLLYTLRAIWTTK